MFNNGETLEDIERWAEATFPHEFKAVKDYLIENDITAKDYGHKDNHSRMLVHSVYVAGDAESMFGSGVIAHVTSDETRPLDPWVVLCEWDYAGEYICNTVNRVHTNFKAPFCWLCRKLNDVSIARFNALIQFICPPSALSVGVSINARYFKKHFKGACRVIAGELEEQRRQNGLAALPTTSQPTLAGPSLTSEPLLASQEQKKLGDMEEFLTSQKASIEEFIKSSQAADHEEKDRLLAETTELKQKLAETEQECRDRKNQLLEYKTNLENIEATLRDRDIDVEKFVAELDRAKHAAEVEREASRKNEEKHKKEVRKVKDEVERLTGEVEKFKKEAAESSQEATKAKRSLEDFQELEGVFERVQKRRAV